ncbi:MAG: L-aspartate oxidase [Anaerosporomusa subterranea]|jgi:L-aspartate oxidase|nr:L-aspartate oxidase [Anaerosporomusa subterranea]
MAERSYITPVWQNHKQLDSKSYDVIVVGTGIAGMTVSLSLDSKLRIALVSKEQFMESSTYKAQGGMAVAVGPDDSAEEHFADTVRVGQGVCREEAVNILAGEGPAALEFLQSLGADFCHNQNGLDLTREAAHSRNRVVHYYDYTGKYIAELLADEVNRHNNIERLDKSFLVDIVTAQDGCCGCIVEHNGSLVYLRAAAVVVATGGYSGLFKRSTNEVSASGDGIAAAYRAGAMIADMEFVQFHPTAFTTLSGKVFLLTEALRGEGAVLRNSAGDRFMFNYNPSGELAPRDEVSRAILRESARQGGGPIYLDARHLGKEYLADRFRQVYSELAKNNYFIERDTIPIAPAAHYTIGGIKTDLWGRTSVGSLYACGEAAATGVHGANRLASNSLLEGIVFGRRIATYINETYSAKREPSELSAGVTEAIGSYTDLNALRTKLDCVAGVVRRGEELEAMLKWLSVGETNHQVSPVGHSYHVYNTYQLAGLLVEAALLRTESRGAHYRSDFPDKNDETFRNHTLQQWRKKAVMA